MSYHTAAEIGKMVLLFGSISTKFGFLLLLLMLLLLPLLLLLMLPLLLLLLLPLLLLLMLPYALMLLSMIT